MKKKQIAMVIMTIILMLVSYLVKESASQCIIAMIYSVWLALKDDRKD